MRINDVTKIFKLWQEPLVITRTTGSYDSNGDWVDNTSTTINFLGVVQNANAQDLEVLPEGDRSNETIKIHTKTQLIALVEGTTEGDTVAYKGFNWKVYNVAARYIGNYFKAILIKEA